VNGKAKQIRRQGVGEAQYIDARRGVAVWLLSLMLFLGSPSLSAKTLEDLLYLALQSYPTILAQMKNKEAADTEKTASILRFLPNPSFNSQQNQVNYAGKPTRSQPAMNFSVSQPLFYGGALVAGYNKADAKLNAADYGVLEQRLDVSRKLVTSYAEWLRAYLKIVALEESLKLHERFVELITHRVQTGIAPESDRDLGVSRLLQVRADLDTQISMERSSLTSLSQLVGEGLKRTDLAESIATPSKLPEREETIDIATYTNPTIHRLSYEADAAEEEAKEARGRALPQLSFHAEHQQNNAIIPGAPSYDAYGLVVAYNPDGGFASVASASAAFTRAEAARTQVETSRRDLLDRLNADFNEYEFSRLKKESLNRSVDLSGEISASYDRQYLVGRKSWLDVMNMVRERTQNRLQLADADGGLIGASHRLALYVDGTSSYDEPPKPHPSVCIPNETCPVPGKHTAKTQDKPSSVAGTPIAPNAALDSTTVNSSLKTEAREFNSKAMAEALTPRFEACRGGSQRKEPSHIA